MDTTSEPPPDDDLATINGPDIPSPSSSSSDGSDFYGLRAENVTLTAELEALRVSFEMLRSKTVKLEEGLSAVEREKEDALKLNLDLSRRNEEILLEKCEIRDEVEKIRAFLGDREDEFRKKMEEVRSELEASRERIDYLEGERREKASVLQENLGSVRIMKEGLIRIIDNVDEEKVGHFNDVEKEEAMLVNSELDEELREFSEEVLRVSKLSTVAERKVSEYHEMRKREKRELENSVVSLTEENRDINSLLRIALVEKEVVEKSLNRLKGGNTDQKRVPLFGLQSFGFGFMMGGASSEQTLDNSGTTISSNVSDSSECEEEVASLASTVEKIMKNLRLEITQLRRSLDESRSDTERLQSLTEKQAQTIAENTMYIEELEDRERVMAQSVEELMIETKELEEELARWREACELEVEAGKTIIQECDKRATILQQELEKTKAALETSNNKLKLKEDLAAAAMAVQAAAEKSLHVADNRASELRERIEELSRQLEEPETRERNRRRVRHICWPWRVLKANAPNSSTTVPRVRNARRMMVPEMQALLHYV